MSPEDKRANANRFRKVAEGAEAMLSRTILDTAEALEREADAEEGHPFIRLPTIG
jgi:hypothetical protein